MTETINQYNDVRIALIKSQLQLKHLKPRVVKAYTYCTTMTICLLTLGISVFTMITLITMSSVASTPEGGFALTLLATAFLCAVSYGIVKFLRPEWEEAKALSTEKHALIDATFHMTSALDDIHQKTNTAKPDSYYTPSWIIQSYADNCEPKTLNNI